MKRFTIFCAIAMIIMSMFSCRKQSLNSYTCYIESKAEIDYYDLETKVSFSSTFWQYNEKNAPSGQALLIYSSKSDMSVNETLSISNYPFKGGSQIFTLSAQQRPLEKKYWYFIELQAPFSEPIRSKVYTMPVYNVPSNSFSLEDGECVVFAQGNLQYRASTGTWRFATNQYDIIGESNQNISSSYSGYIDLFGFGTSGYNYKPYSYALTASYYATGNIANTKNDWGVYCSISNGGNYKWRTLESEDWVYIYEGRPNAYSKRSRATVNGVKGMILLPDKWTIPSGCSFSPNASYFTTNTYSVSQWKKMENAGAVFLPATGHRIETTVYGLEIGNGSYFTSTWDRGGISAEGNEYCAQPARFVFSESYVYSDAIYTGTNVYNAYGSAVRLVRTVQTSYNTQKRAPRKIVPNGVAPV